MIDSHFLLIPKEDYGKYDWFMINIDVEVQLNIKWVYKIKCVYLGCLPLRNGLFQLYYQYVENFFN